MVIVIEKNKAVFQKYHIVCFDSLQLRFSCENLVWKLLSAAWDNRYAGKFE